jgi:hypothetical protein
MDETPETPEQERAFFDYMDAREDCLTAAVGSFVSNNVSTESLRIIVESTTDKTIKLAAQIVLETRGISPP